MSVFAKISEASFAGLVVLAGEFHPIPFRTRPLKPPAPMVLRLKPRESRSLPVQPRTLHLLFREHAHACLACKHAQACFAIPPPHIAKAPHGKPCGAFVFIRRLGAARPPHPTSWRFP